jgi:PadR family transcriptional regulator, regulatory protein PadR
MRKNTLAVLTALSVEPDKAFYGLEIYDRTGLLPGTTYPILLRSENAGWVRSYWADGDPTDPQQPRRRYCQITDLGLGAARTATARTTDGRGLARRWLGWALPILPAAASNAAAK